MNDPSTANTRGIHRRRFLELSGLAALGHSLPSPRAFAQQAGSPSPIRSCILIFYYGGPSHIDTWDPKPSAPAEVRGLFRPIATRVPGISLGEHLPHSSRVVDRLAIVRGVHHPMTNHNAAAFATLSGRPPARGDLELLTEDRGDPPCIGSTLSHALRPGPEGLPAFVALPHTLRNVVKLPGQTAGFLGAAHDPLQVVNDPSAPGFHLDEIQLPEGVGPDRLQRRERLRDQLFLAESSGGPGDYRDRAVGLLQSEPARRAFQLEAEDPKLRDRYGRTKFGQSLLLARRLVEAGVRFVAAYDHEVNGQLANWDAHADVFPRLKDDLLPPTDQAFAALIEDLENRRLLESTLVVALGEFGRTPKINGQAGRDHWPYCFSAVLAGGGIRGGMVHGASDALGAYPDRDAVTPGDLAATLLWRFGLEPDREIVDPAGRPFRMAEGQAIRALFS